MAFLIDVCLGIIFFALLGGLTAAGVIGSNFSVPAQSAFGIALIIYAAVLVYSGWSVYRARSDRLRALGSAWLFQYIAAAAKADGLLLLIVLIVSIMACRYALVKNDK